MLRSKLLIVFLSLVVGVILSLLVGTLASNIYQPYAESDSQISNVFEISSIIALPALVSMSYLVFIRLFSTK